MLERILLGVLGGGNIILFIKFMIERHDRKQERAEDKEEKAAEKELESIKHKLLLLEKDGLRTQMILLILLRPEEKREILTIARHYFEDLHGNWYTTSIFNNWLTEYKIAEPEWFDGKD